MTKLLVLSAGAVAAAGASLFAFGTGLAAAQDVVGMTYADAQSELSGSTVILGTVVGDKLPLEECFVVSTSSPTFIDQGGSPRSGEIRLNLSCYPQPATAHNPGFSAGNNQPDAQAVRDAVEQQQAESEAGVTSESER